MSSSFTIKGNVKSFICSSTIVRISPVVVELDQIKLAVSATKLTSTHDVCEDSSIRATFDPVSHIVKFYEKRRESIKIVATLLTIASQREPTIQGAYSR
jgi:hypothetical protein